MPEYAFRMLFYRQNREMAQSPASERLAAL
jgi:hypothetical protein